METERIAPRRSFPVVPLLIAGAVVVGGGAFFALRPTSPPDKTASLPSTVVPPEPEKAVSTPPPPKTTPPVTTPPTTETAGATQAEATVTVDIKTTPSEARVVDVSDGRVVGTTPLEQPMARKDGDLTLRIEKEGYLPKTVVVPRSRDFHGAFKLERPAGHEAHGSHGGHEPSPSPSSTEHIIKL